MSDLNPKFESGEADSTVDTDPVDGEGTTQDAPAEGEKDWQSEYEAARNINKRLETKMKRNLSRVEKLEAELATLRNGVDEDGKPNDLEAIRTQARAEAAASVLRDRTLDRIETKAAKLFADPEDARALLASRIDEFVDDGKVDTDAIEDALADLLKKKPHLSATAKRFQGGADGGARKGSQVSQLNEQDLKRMTPEQIVKARETGRLNDLLGTT